MTLSQLTTTYLMQWRSALALGSLLTRERLALIERITIELHSRGF